MPLAGMWSKVCDCDSSWLHTLSSLVNTSSTIKLYDITIHVLYTYCFLQLIILNMTSSPKGIDRSPWSQHNVLRHHNLVCSKAGNSELETVTRN